ncbi:hypothetical protein JOQ06_002150, partial [Pogonophryne albipinna]
MDILYSVILWIVFLQLLACDVNGAVIRERTQYTRDVLLQLNMASLARMIDTTLQLPDIIRRNPNESCGATGHHRRKRGILGNVQSLRNKVDELQGNVRFQKNFRDCCVLAFTETWLTDCNQDNDLFIDGFGAPFRLDRKAEMTGKTKGAELQDNETSHGPVIDDFVKKSEIQ